MIVIKFSQTYVKLSKITHTNMWFSVCWVISNFVIFHKIKVAKHIWDQCCHLVAETSTWYPLILIDYRGRHWKVVWISYTSFATLRDKSAYNFSFLQQLYFLSFYKCTMLDTATVSFILFLPNFILFTFSVLPSIDSN